MSRSSQIPLPPWDPFLAIRRILLLICCGDAVAAALLNEFRFVYDSLCNTGKPPRFQRSMNEWVEALLGLYRDTRIRAALKYLAERGLITIEPTPGEPSWYELNSEKVRELIDEHARSDAYRSADPTPTESEVGSLEKRGGPPRNLEGSPSFPEGVDTIYPRTRVREQRSGECTRDDFPEQLGLLREAYPGTARTRLDLIAQEILSRPDVSVDQDAFDLVTQMIADCPRYAKLWQQPGQKAPPDWKFFIRDYDPGAKLQISDKTESIDLADAWAKEGAA